MTDWQYLLLRGDLFARQLCCIDRLLCQNDINLLWHGIAIEGISSRGQTRVLPLLFNLEKEV